MASLPYRVKAVYDYSSPHEDDLSFPNGQIITVTDEEDADWYYGEYTGTDGSKAQGLFPRNFVERYEPTTPPRPSRPARAKRDVDTKAQPEISNDATESSAVAAEQAPVAGPVHGDEDHVGQTVPAPQESAHDEQEVPPSPKLEPVGTRSTQGVAGLEESQPSESIPSPTPVSKSAAAPAPASSPATASKPKPPVSEKPTSGSFRDRIAAFNKPAAPPVAPVKPGGLGQSSTSGFVKKQYVAPPPSRNAYVPPPREPPPQKTYRREESEDINPAEVESRESEAVVSSEGIVTEPNSEDQSKPASLKDRIALLQKQQLEQAARNAEAAQKREKPKRPPKKRSESQQRPTNLTEDERHDRGAELGGEDDELGRGDDDGLRGVPTKRRSRQTEDAPNAILSSVPRELVSDTNDADQSAGGETEDGSELTASQHLDTKPRPRESIPQSQPLSTEPEGVSEGQKSDEDEQDESEGEEEEMDPEVKKRMEIRERMAKMSGGMGMAGMFGPPGGLPMGSRKPKQSSGASRTQASEDSIGDSGAQTQATQAVPIMALPGMSIPGLQRVRTPEGEPELEETQPVEQMGEQDEILRTEPQTKTRRSIDQAQPLQGISPTVLTFDHPNGIQIVQCHRLLPYSEVLLRQCQVKERSLHHPLNVCSVKP